MFRNAGRMHLLVLCAVVGLARSSAAQDPPVAGIGDRVRLTFHGSQGSRVTGRLAEVAGDSLILAGAKERDRRVLPRSTVRQVEISLRQESQVARGIGLGALGGSLLGVAVSVFAASAFPSCDQAGLFEVCTKVTVGRVLSVIGLGAAAGAAMGLQLASGHPRDVWGPARLADATVASGTWSRPLPTIGLGMAGEHRVLLIGVRFTR